MTESRLEAFVRAVAFREPDLPVDVVVDVLRGILSGGVVFRDDAHANRVLVKLAALAVAFWSECRDVLAGNFELDHRDEAVLDAVVEHLSKRSDGS